MPIIFENNRYYSSEDFVFQQQFSFDARPHTHDFIEIVFMIGGRGIHTVDGQNYPMTKGDLLVINPGSVHSYQSESGMRFYNIIIKPEFIEKDIKGDGSIFSLLNIESFSELSDIVQKGNTFIRFSNEERSRLENLITWMNQEKQSPESGSNLILHSYTNVLLTLVFRKMSLPMSDELAINNDLLNFIQQNCSLPLTCGMVAKKCSYNPSYFSRLFRQYAGITFSQYLNECRLNRACELLENTDLAVEKIISESGFSDRTKFFKAFVSRFGTTPLKYRKSKK